MPLQNTDLFVVERGGTNYKMAGDQVTAKTGVTGASVTPAGDSSQRPAGPTSGMLRYNNQLGFMEVYTDGVTQWNQLNYVPIPAVLPASITYSTNTAVSGVIVCNNLTVNAGVTLTVSNYGVLFICYGTATINGTINADGAGAYGQPPSSFGVGGVGLYDTYSSPTWAGPGGGIQSELYPPRAYTPSVYLGGSSSFGGAYGIGPNSSVFVGQSGSAGGYIAIRAYSTITTGAAAILTANAQNADGVQGGTGDFYVLGLSGSSGGLILLQSDSNISTAGVISATGGNGSNAGCSSAGCVAGHGGGNGGSGGLILLQTSGTLSQGHTAQLAGGAGGPGIPGPLTLGSPTGASHGGFGGFYTGGGSSSGSPGGTGVTIFAGSPLP